MWTKNDKPIICTQINDREISKMLKTIKNVVKRGTEALGVQLESLKNEYITEENIEKIVKAAKGIPIYVTDYMDKTRPETPDQKEKMLTFAAKCGAELIDIPGNMFSNDEFELTFDEEAVKRQKKMIKNIHALNRKVLISTHILKYTKQEEVLKIALEQQSRGADVVKIVVACDTDKELLDNLDTTRLLKEKLNVPFLFLSSGETGKFHRNVGPFLGVCMWLCAPCRGKYDSGIQPILEHTQDLRKNFYD